MNTKTLAALLAFAAAAPLAAQMGGTRPSAFSATNAPEEFPFGGEEFGVCILKDNADPSGRVNFGVFRAPTGYYRQARRQWINFAKAAAGNPAAIEDDCQAFPDRAAAVAWARNVNGSGPDREIEGFEPDWSTVHPPYQQWRTARLEAEALERQRAEERARAEAQAAAEEAAAAAAAQAAAGLASQEADPSAPSPTLAAVLGNASSAAAAPPAAAAGAAAAPTTAAPTSVTTSPLATPRGATTPQTVGVPASTARAAPPLERPPGEELAQVRTRTLPPEPARTAPPPAAAPPAAAAPLPAASRAATATVARAPAPAPAPATAARAPAPAPEPVNTEEERARLNREAANFAANQVAENEASIRRAEIERAEYERSLAQAARDRAAYERALEENRVALEENRRARETAERQRRVFEAEQRRYNACLGGDQAACADIAAGKPVSVAP